MNLTNIICEILDGNLVEARKITQSDFLNKAKQFHGDKYDYNKVNYVDSTTPVEIICHKKDIDGNEHGSWITTPNNHLNGRGCKKCSFEKSREKYSHGTDKFIEMSNGIHGNEMYDYSQVKYVNNIIPVEIICHKKDKNGVDHGSFKQRPAVHLLGMGCPKCGINKVRTQTVSNKDEFINKAELIHGKNRYDYSEFNYINAITPAIVICHKNDMNGNEHGPFLISSNNLLSGKGCPKCKNSTGETKIRILLDNEKMEYIEQYQNKFCTSFKNTSHNRKCIPLKFDFYLPKMNTIIEFDGKYHFEKHHSGTNNQFMSGVLNDREKNSFTKLKGIKLIRICYLDIKNLEEEIINGLKSKEQLYLSTNYPSDLGWRDDDFTPTRKFINKYIE